MSKIPIELITSGLIHKQVREYLEDEVLAKSEGMKLIDLANNIENKIKELTSYDPENPLNAGIAFPTGLSINNCAAHWTPNPGDTYQTLKKSDIIKIDYGVHVNGYITDGAFSFSLDSKFDTLIEASNEATYKGIELAGPDADLCDIGGEIQEVIESYEVNLNGKTYPLKSIGNLCGHQIGQYKIHCGKPVPNIATSYDIGRMKEGEQYAIETFPTTGSGNVIEDKDPANWSHFMEDYMSHNYDETQEKEGYRLKMDKRFKTLAFCKRWMKDDDLWDSKKFKKACKKGYYQEYPPLYDVNGSYVSQTEHSIFIMENGNQVLN